MSLGNLLIAKKIIGDNNDVLLVCADAARLPLKDASISGLWSVQTIQHFPDAVFDCFEREMTRILDSTFIIEIYNLNPALLYRLIYSLLCKQLHIRGRIGAMELNRLSVKEWMNKFGKFRSGPVKTSHGYSELFFHPDFHLRPTTYPLKLEKWITARLPGIASLIARQGQIRMESVGDATWPARPPVLQK
jgi:ubiquinone/menaquinone biosynthesis C-methylase UbiE